MNKKTIDLTTGTIWKVLLAFIIPIVIGSLIQQLYTTVDAVVVGQFVGKDGLAAIDSMATLFKFPICFLNGLSAGATIVISKYFGQKNKRGLDNAVHTAYSIALILGVVSSATGVILSPELVKVMEVPEDIYEMTLSYVRIYFVGLWLVTLYNMFAGVLRAFGDSRTPLNILIICCIINIAGDLLLVGYFHMGVSGAAVATIVSQGVSAVLSGYKLARHPAYAVSQVWKIRISFEHFTSILSLGLPLAFQGVLYPIANSIVQANVNNMGTDNIAAWAICGKLDLMVWLIADAMTPVMSTYVAQNVGAGQNDRILKGARFGSLFSAITVMILSSLLFFFSGPLSRLFVTGADAEVLIPIIVRFMHLLTPFYFFYAFGAAFSGVCCGMGDTLKSMIITLICTCGLRIALIFGVLPFYRSMETIIFVYIASWIVTGSAFTILFFTERAKHLKVEKA